MRSTVFFFLAMASAYSQSLSFGVKAGVPVTDAYSDLQIPNAAARHSIDRWTLGPTVELHLPFHLSVELDALYRKSNFSTNGGVFVGTSQTSVNEWQFPLLAKVEIVPLGPVRPFVDAGFTYRHLSVGQGRFSVQNPNNEGLTIGGGVTLKLLKLRVSPELRYTHWGQIAFSNLAVLSSKNQADFLVGLTF